MSPWTLTAATEAIKTGRLTARALVEDCLERIDTHPELAAFVTVTAETARRAADAADRAPAAGVLHGLPLGLKDIIETEGVLTAGGSRLFLDRVPARSAALWERLEAAGAILLGKTTTWEFAIGGTRQDLPFPPALNPWDATRETGGSSSGSAAAVAAGLVPAAIGTDTAGSIRVPAAWCGCAGLKPTQGLVSRAGLYPLSHTLDHAGPIAWTVRDCALLMTVLAGPDARDPASRHAPALDYLGRLDGGVSGLKVGIAEGLLDDIDAEMAEGITAAGRSLSDAGAELVPVTLPPLRDFDAACNVITRSETFAYHRDALATRPEAFGEETRARMMAGGLVAAAEYIDALRIRTELIEAMERLFTGVDLLLAPLAGSTAPETGSATSYARLATRPFSVTGSPALSVCSGWASDGLPLSVQIVGPAYGDPTVLAAGAVIEAALGKRERRV